MSFKLPNLNYALNQLEPHISEQTLEFHYGKHHQAYVNNLNNLIQGTKFEQKPLEEIIIHAEGAIFNNAAQIWNHTFYFTGFNPNPAQEPIGEFMNAIKSSFGSFSEFKEKFSKAAGTLFGSGWAWLIKKNDGTLEILKESNAGNPIRGGLTPILTCDVWEHAYYLDYQNKRPVYIQAFWNVVDWEIISSRYRS